MTFIPIQRMRERLKAEAQDSDTTLYSASLYYGELVLKLITAGMIAAVRDDRSRLRYRQCHHLVRADGLGDWPMALRDVLMGQSSQYLDPSAQTDVQELTQKASRGTLAYDATQLLHECLFSMQIEPPAAGGRMSIMHWAEAFVHLRNKTRGHGAQRSSVLGMVSAKLRESVNRVADGLSLFERPWAYLKRNLSGKYRVTVLAGDPGCFADLKRRSDVRLENGVYAMFDVRRRVELLHSNPEGSDFLLPNGSFTPKRFEILSYITGDTQFVSSQHYLLPAEELPASETEGLGNLNEIGDCFCNIPPEPSGYVARSELESQLRRELAMHDRHPIVSLTGPGGIGKTSTTLRVLHRMAREDPVPYGIIVWFSARDIDLLPYGPKTVRPSGISLRDFANMFVGLLMPHERNEKGFKAVDYLAREMAKPSYAPILFVFDNFETVVNPGELFAWIDSMIRAPNKILITTRMRGDFRADYPLQVGGMNEAECCQLIDIVGSSLNIISLVGDPYRQQIIDESDGHPYVIKVLLGEVAKVRCQKDIKRIVAGRDEMLIALFERTYAALSPAAQRIFLLLANWRSMVPELAVEAVVLRQANEKIDAQMALEELMQSSLIEELASDDGDRFLHVPLAAGLFGHVKLVASPWKAAVEVDTSFLRAFGATSRTDVRHGLSPRITRLFHNVAVTISKKEHTLDDVKPTLEYVCRRYPEGWLLLAELYAEMSAPGMVNQIKECYQHYLELNASRSNAGYVWKQLADLCRDTGDVVGEFHAVAGMCKIPDIPTYNVSDAANRINQRMTKLTYEQRCKLGKEEKQILLADIVDTLEDRIGDLDAKDCSRLAWLHIHLGNDPRAHDLATQGLQMDPGDIHCQKLVDRLR